MVMQKQDTTIQKIQKIDVTKGAMRHEAVEMPSCDAKTLTDDSMTFPFTGAVPLTLLNAQSETSSKHWFSSAMDTQYDEGADASAHPISSTTAMFSSRSIRS